MPSNEFIRKMTRDEYDAVPLIQRGFYDKLIESGKLEIFVPPLPMASPERTIEARKGPYEVLFNQDVVIFFNSDKRAVRGILTAVYTYEVVLDRGEIVCMKSNILCIRKQKEDRMDDSQPKEDRMDD